MQSRLSEHLDSKILDTSFIPTEFSAYAKNQVSVILRDGINDQAVKRRKVEAITIDGANSLDLDDAIWAERTKEGYCVWIHISDVAEAIPLFSPLDREAFQRTTSIYRKDNIINMLPPELSNGVLSLDEKDEKYTMTLQIQLDNEGKVKQSSFYESLFKNQKRYNYESFGEDYKNPDSQHYNTIHLFKEISDKLRLNRAINGGIVPYEEEDRRMYIGPKTLEERMTYSKKIAHDIIESFMVLANTATGNYFNMHGVDAIFKHHEKVDERSFYIYKPGFHTGLGVHNYTHFTSPIRRYVDVVVHRVIKAIERGERIPYHISDLKLIASHSNNTRLKIETVGSQVDFEYRGEQFLERIKTRLGKDPEVYDMKNYIRESVHKGKKMPKCMNQAIRERIEQSPLGTWTWLIGVILFGKDRDLKEFLKKKLLKDKVMGPSKILHIMAQTQILRGGDTIFSIHEEEQNNMFKVEILLHGNNLCSYSMNSGKLGKIGWVKHKVRTKAIEKLFNYFIHV